MKNRISDLRSKEIINVCNGHRLGYAGDVEIDIHTGQVLALIVPGPCRFFGLFWREDDYFLPWDCISRSGDDIIIVDIPGEYDRCKRDKHGLL